MLENKDIISIASVIFVAVSGVIANMLIIKYNQRQSISSKIVDRYFDIRNSMVDILSDFASLRVINNYSEEKLTNYIKQITKMYYSFYDFLPKEVLHELICLYANLTDDEHRLYTVKGEDMTAVTDERDIEKFIKDLALIGNINYYIYAKLNSDDIEVKKSVSINIQSRKVLACMNKFFTVAHLASWDNKLRKDIN